MQVLDWMKGLLTELGSGTAMRAALIFFVGMLLARVVPARITWGVVPAQRTAFVRTLVRYGLIGVTLAWVLRELGFDLGVLLGAAGILTVAVGFASQTSASNLISGLFLLGERPFGIGDLVRVADVTGEVLSIDALSVKIRTFDNLFVRVPNETMLKSNVTTLTRFPIRRVDLKVGVAYKEDLEQVSLLLQDLADKNPICLAEPKPMVIMLGYGESSIDIQFSVWASTDKFLDLRNEMYADIKAAFDDAGIEIPFPHRTLYTGAVTAPLPVKLVEP